MKLIKCIISLSIISCILSMLPFNASVKAQTNSIIDYELYDYFNDIRNCNINSESLNSNSPWSVELKPYKGQYQDVIDTCQYNDFDKYNYCYNSKKAWGYYPGFSFYYPKTYTTGRYQLNYITPTNSAWLNDNSWTFDAAYTFKTQKSGIYTFHKANQNLSAAYSETNFFKQVETNDDKLDFGVKITVNGKTIWPVSGEIQNEFLIFGNKNAQCQSVEVPEIEEIVLNKNDILRVEFTVITPAVNSYTQRICGNFALSLTDTVLNFNDSSDNVRLDINSKIIYLSEKATDNNIKSSFNDLSSVSLPLIYNTGEKIVDKSTNENYFIAFENDSNGDGIINIKDLIRAKKISAELISVNKCEIYAVTKGKNSKIKAYDISCLKQKLLREDGDESSSMIYKKADINLSQNLIENFNSYDLGFNTEIVNNKSVIKMENHTKGEGCGAFYVIHNPEMATYILSGYSKAIEVTRTENTEYYSYALLAHIDYSDDTSKEFSTLFSYGTHDFEYRETSFSINKSAKSISVFVFLRGSALGTAYFDDITLKKGTADTLTFNNMPVIKNDCQKESISNRCFETQDGLKLIMSDNAVKRVIIDSKDISSDSSSGFMVSDVTDDNGVYDFIGNINENGKYIGTETNKGFTINAKYTEKSDCINVSGVIKDSTQNKDGRALRLSYVLPISSSNWYFASDILTSQMVNPLSGGGVYKQFGEGYMSNVDWDSEKRSYIPTCALYNEELGIAISVSLDFPQYFELEYNATTKSFIITFQLGITNEAPDSAKFDFSIYKIDNPEWGFRSAMQKYSTIHADYYKTREKEHGLWLAWSDITNVPNVEDFNIKFKEIDKDERTTGAFEVSKNIKGYHYIELGDWWISNCESQSNEDIWKRIDEISNGDLNERATLQAKATKSCFSMNIDGTINHNPVNNPWCLNGSQIHINANPNLPSRYNFFNLWYNDELKNKWFNKNYMTGTATFDGIYLDELSGWWLGNANFNTQQYKYTTVPLTYSPYYKKAMLHRASTTFECAKAIADDLHSIGKTVFANKVPDKVAFYVPLIDASGTEQTALSGNKYNPQSIEKLSTWRTLSYKKPFCILLSNDYDVFNNSMMESYFNRCLVYAIFPSPSENYSDNSKYFTSENKYYERDRNIFKKYMPILKTISEIGWNAETDAKASDDSLIVERYGNICENGEIYIAIYNPTDVEINTTVNFDSKLLNINGNEEVVEAINNTTYKLNNSKVEVNIPQGKTIVLHIKKQ